MGQDIKFNWILKLPKKDLENLVEGEERKFDKVGKRIYPMNNEIFLIDEDFNVKGVIMLKNYSINPNSTSGEYRLIKIPSESEKITLNHYIKGMHCKSDF